MAEKSIVAILQNKFYSNLQLPNIFPITFVWFNKINDFAATFVVEHINSIKCHTTVFFAALESF